MKKDISIEKYILIGMIIIVFGILLGYFICKINQESFYNYEKFVDDDKICITEPGKAYYPPEEKCCGDLRSIFGSELENLLFEENPKGRLLEYFTQNSLEPPIFNDPNCIGGEDHKPIYQSTIIGTIEDETIEIKGEGMLNKSEAEKIASEEFLKLLKIKSKPYFPYFDKLNKKWQLDYLMMISRKKT